MNNVYMPIGGGEGGWRGGGGVACLGGPGLAARSGGCGGGYNTVEKLPLGLYTGGGKKGACGCLPQ